MASRFRLFDNGGKSADRYTLIDCKPRSTGGTVYYSYFAFDENPTNPQGIGMICEARQRDYYGVLDTAGKRISLLDLPQKARDAARVFLQDCGASKANVATLARKYVRGPSIYNYCRGCHRGVGIECVEGCTTLRLPD